ncbi:MAG TPA: hypothetical protein VKT18_07180 [Acidimicrobiales bacterium]|nr:hypothetical protein [Acidimicrobiales bacterium]
MAPTTETVHGGIRERATSIVGSAGDVPQILWSPLDTPPAGLVLVGHGGSGHKREDYVLALARRLVRTAGLAVCAIDGPVHGERRTRPGEDPTLVLMEFAQAWSSDETLTDRMVGDWTATLDALVTEPELSGVPVGYWGLSMGTLLGLPFVAADERVSACVLGLAGMLGPSSARLALDAARVEVPTLFLAQLDDELFSFTTALALFGALGSREKRLFAAPGRHRDVPADAFSLSVEFLAAQLRARAEGDR